MQTQITIKRSPIVLIRTLVAIEILAFIAYYVAAQLDAYKIALYQGLFLSNFLSYSALKFLVLSGFQFLVTVFAFMRWYYENYSVKNGFILHRRGVIFKKEKSVPINNSASITLSSGPFAKLFHYGSIIIENGFVKKPFVVSDISRPEDFLQKLEESINPEGNLFLIEPNLPELIKTEEHERLEFKASFRFDYKNSVANRELEKMVMKTIAAFLNTKGGHLVIGVDDQRKPTGIHKDYETLRRPDRDGFENHFTNIFNVMIGPEFRNFVKLWFNFLDDFEICIIQVAPGSRPAYLKSDGNEHFYVRTGNATTPLKLSETDVYRRSRWP